MNTSRTFRFASFSAACAVTLAILMGVSSMAMASPAPASMATAASVQVG